MTIGEYVYTLNMNKPNGFYVDVGAYDGITNDETIFLERNGWDGICIEGVPAVYARLKQNRKAKTYNAFVAGKTEERDVLILHPGFMGSTFADNINQPHVSWLKNSLDPTHKIVKVNAIHLETILDELNAPKEIDLLKTDTEGACLEILKSLSYSRYVFKVISCELGLPGVEYSSFDEGKAFLESKGYDYIKSGNQNDVFVHKDTLK